MPSPVDQTGCDTAHGRLSRRADQEQVPPPHATLPDKVYHEAYDCEGAEARFEGGRTCTGCQMPAMGALNFQVLG